MLDDLLRIARTDPDPSVRAQAVRAVADLADPVLVRHRLDAGAGDNDLAGKVADLGKGQDGRVVLEVIVALGRLRWAGLPDWLRQNLGTGGLTPRRSPDAALAHAAQQALRRCGNWNAVLKCLDEPADTPLRAIALRAVADCFEPKVVDGLIERFRTATDPKRRREYADTLARVCKKPGPWVYWGYRPGPRPANTVLWERTEAIAHALDRMLIDPDRSVRLLVLQRLQREKVPVRLAALTRWLDDELQPEHVAGILAALADQPVADSRRTLEAVVRNPKHNSMNRLTALALFAKGLEANPEPFLTLAQTLEDGPVLADILRRLGKNPRLPAVPVLAAKLRSADAEVRAAAIEALGDLRAEEGREQLLPLLQDKDAHVRRAASAAAGKLKARQAIEPLLKLATDPDPAVKGASIDSLRLLREPRVVPLAVAALADHELELKALECLRELGGPEQSAAVAELAKRSPSAEVLAAAVRALTEWHGREGLTSARRQELDGAVAEVCGKSGVLLRWEVTGPVQLKAAPGIVERFASVGQTGDTSWSTRFAAGTEAHVTLAPKDSTTDGLWFACTDVIVSEPTPVEFLASSRGSLQVWLNGRSLYRRDQAGNTVPDSDRFAGTLARGSNRLLVQVGPAGNALRGVPVVFQLRFRRKSGTAEHERLTQAVLSRSGNPERGRQLFLNTEKSLCLRCHRLGTQGERIGPELTGVGSRFSRIHIVESILEPSRTIAPSYGTVVVTLKNGKTLTGVKVTETEKSLTLADNQGQKHELARADIEEQQASPLSTMPEGLEKRLSEAEFVDLIAFLVSQQQGRGP